MVLSIAGSDPSGGAGLQADLRTFAALGVYGCAAPAALTAQNARGVRDVMTVPAEFLRWQLDAVFDGARVDAVKIGMLGNAANVEVVAEVLAARNPRVIVLDPVLRSTSGARLLEEGALDALRRRLVPLAMVITPNAPEAGALLGRAAPRTVAESREAAEALVALGARAALVTGGHLDDPNEAVDVLHDGGGLHEFRLPRVSGGGAHGTGCVLSSALAARLAHGRALVEACADAQRFVAEVLGQASGFFTPA